jgi:hypothetical protein
MKECWEGKQAASRLVLRYACDAGIDRWVAVANGPSNSCDLRAIGGNHGTLDLKAGDRFQGGAQ